MPRSRPRTRRLVGLAISASYFFFDAAARAQGADVDPGAAEPESAPAPDVGANTSSPSDAGAEEAPAPAIDPETETGPFTDPEPLAPEPEPGPGDPIPLPPDEPEDRSFGAAGRPAATRVTARSLRGPELVRMPGTRSVSSARSSSFRRGTRGARRRAPSITARASPTARSSSVRPAPLSLQRDHELHQRTPPRSRRLLQELLRATAGRWAASSTYACAIPRPTASTGWPIST